MNTKNILKLTIVLIVVLSVIYALRFVAFAHSGRTDANGGHWDRSTGTYHYHNNGKVASKKGFYHINGNQLSNKSETNNDYKQEEINKDISEILSDYFKPISNVTEFEYTPLFVFEENEKKDYTDSQIVINRTDVIDSSKVATIQIGTYKTDDEKSFFEVLCTILILIGFAFCFTLLLTGICHVQMYKDRICDNIQRIGKNILQFIVGVVCLFAVAFLPYLVLSLYLGLFIGLIYLIATYPIAVLLLVIMIVIPYVFYVLIDHKGRIDEYERKVNEYISYKTEYKEKESEYWEFERIPIPEDCEIGSDKLPKEKGVLNGWGDKFTVYQSRLGNKIHTMYGCCAAYKSKHVYYFSRYNDLDSLLCKKCGKNYVVPNMLWYENYLQYSKLLRKVLELPGRMEILKGKIDECGKRCNTLSMKLILIFDKNNRKRLNEINKSVCLIWNEQIAVVQKDFL